MRNLTLGFSGHADLTGERRINPSNKSVRQVSRMETLDYIPVAALPPTQGPAQAGPGDSQGGG
ncbi:MAG: hypothetical protein C5B49_05210 [Bdellovibrio sp.]|nr:MAG: hypothetical protein C5B49_05210 [Bdellovibrio sp.]